MQNKMVGREEDPGTFQSRANFIELGKKKKKQLKGNPEEQRGRGCCGDLAFLREGTGRERKWGHRQGRMFQSVSAPSSRLDLGLSCNDPRDSTCPNVLPTYGVLFASIDIGLCGFQCENMVSYLQRQLSEVTQTIFRTQGLWSHLS